MSGSHDRSQTKKSSDSQESSLNDTKQHSNESSRSPSPDRPVTTFYQNRDRNPLFLVSFVDSLKKTKTKDPEKQKEITTLIQKLSDIPNEMEHEEYKKAVIKEFMMAFTKAFIKEMGNKTLLGIKKTNPMGEDTLKVLWDAAIDLDKSKEWNTPFNRLFVKYSDSPLTPAHVDTEIFPLMASDKDIMDFVFREAINAIAQKTKAGENTFVNCIKVINKLGYVGHREWNLKVAREVLEMKEATIYVNVETLNSKLPGLTVEHNDPKKQKQTRKNYQSLVLELSKSDSPLSRGIEKYFHREAIKVTGEISKTEKSVVTIFLRAMTALAASDEQGKIEFIRSIQAVEKLGDQGKRAWNELVEKEFPSLDVTELHIPLLNPPDEKRIGKNYNELVKQLSEPNSLLSKAVQQKMKDTAPSEAKKQIHSSSIHQTLFAHQTSTAPTAPTTPAVSTAPIAGKTPPDLPKNPPKPRNRQTG